MTAEQDAAAIAALRAMLAGGTGQPAGVSVALPPVREDPAVVAGYEIQAAYPGDVQAARNAAGVSDIDRAKGVLRVWKAATDRLVGLAQDLQQRREARLRHLESRMPVGPGIAEGTSAADRTVLLAAFRSAWAEARGLTLEQRLEALGEAMRFGDDVRVRALLTASIDDALWPLVDQWAATQPAEVAVELAEWRELRQALNGWTIGNSFAAQAFALPRRPPEWAELPRMVEAANRSIIAANGSRARTANSRGLPLLELSMSEFAPVAG